MKFILTIDTEGDNQWDHGRDVTVENIKSVPRFQNLCDRYHIRPTYLVTSEVCENAYARELFTDYLLTDRAEIGAHLHSWTTAPFLEKAGFRYNDENHAFAHELPEDLVTQKIKNLTDLIESSFKVRPLSFRSGRYGFNETIARILKTNNYLVDSSVTPYINWSSFKGLPGGKGGPDFINQTSFPHKYDFDNGSLLEIPVTIIPTRFPLNRNKTISEYYFRNVDDNIFLKALRRLFFKNQPVWLRPHPSMTISTFNVLLNEAQKIRLPYIVMMFHSSELMPGGSIYRGNVEAINKLYDLLERFFDLLYNRNIASVTLAEAAKGHQL